MDLAQFDVREDAATLHLKDPIDRKPLYTDSGEPVTIDLLSIYSRKGTVVKYAMASEALLVANEDGQIDPEKAADQTAKRLAELTTGWSNIVVNGEEWEFSEAKARELYSREWIRAQADSFVNRRANHLGKSSANSSTSHAASSNSQKRDKVHA